MKLTIALGIIGTSAIDNTLNLEMRKNSFLQQFENALCESEFY